MSYIILVSIILILVFSFVILFGAPYLPTLQKQAEDAFELLDLRTGDRLLELGSGDGRVLRLAAQRGIRGVGYELNPLLVIYSTIRHWRYRKLLTFKCRDYWRVRLPKCEGIYVFLLDRYMKKLDTKIIQEVGSPVKLVSYAFKVPDRVATKEKNGLFLYEY